MESRLNFNHLFFGGITLVWLLAYWPTHATVLVEWQGNGPYSHGFLALVISAYLIWQKRHLLRWSTDIGVIEIGLIIGLGFSWWISHIAGVQLLAQVGAIALFSMLLLFIYGWPVCKQLIIPIVVVTFALPIWDFVQYPLRDLSTEVSHHLLLWLNVPVLREGYYFTVPGGRFFVEPACAGLSFFLVALTLSILFAYVNHLNIKTSCYFVIFALTLALVSNWIRIVVIMVVGNYYQMEHPIVQDHLTFGWIVYAVMLVPLFWIGNRFFVGNHSQSNVQQSSQTETLDPRFNATNVKVVAAFALVLLFPITDLLLKDYGVDDQYSLQLPTLTHYTRIDDMTPQELQWQPTFRGSASEHYAKYSYQQQDIAAYVANYTRQEQNKELIYYFNSLYNKEAWRKVSEKKVALGPDDKNYMSVIRLEDKNKKRMIGYWYLIGGKRTTSAKLAKLYEVRSLFLGNRGSSVVALAVDYTELGEQHAFNLLVETAKNMQSHFSSQ